MNPPDLPGRAEAAPPPAEQRLYRTFVTDERRRPACGDDDCMLGVRPIDIRPDKDGMVEPGKGGMSVCPDPARLPGHLRPRSLGGETELPVFWIVPSRLGERLKHRPSEKKPEKHGTVEPALAMKLDAYKAALAATGPAWEEWRKEVA